MGKKMVNIKEQVIEDIASGLTIEFELRKDGESRIYLSGDGLPFSNREIHFGKDGQYVGAGTWLKG